MRNESTGSAEKRNDPTYEDYEIMYGLKNVKLAIAAVKACQLADPDGDTDPDDLAVMAALEDADSAVDQAIVAQSKDGRPDDDDDDDERAQVGRFWTSVEDQARNLGIDLVRDDEGVTARMEIDDEAIEVRRMFSAKQREAMADKGQAMSDGSYPVANEADLRNAIQAIGRAKNPSEAKAHIKKRAAALGLTKLIPDDWRAEYGVATQARIALAENDSDDLLLSLKLRSAR